MTSSDHRHSPWFGYGAALWALIFAALHIAWAAGWYIGLRAEEARRAFSQPWFLVYDLIVAGLCVLAVPVALALVRPPPVRQRLRWLIGLLAWAGTGLLVVRSGASLVQVSYLVVTDRFVLRAQGLWEVWFYIGAVLFGLSTYRFWTTKPTASLAA